MRSSVHRSLLRWFCHGLNSFTCIFFQFDGVARWFHLDLAEYPEALNSTPDEEDPGSPASIPASQPARRDSPSVSSRSSSGWSKSPDSSPNRRLEEKQNHCA